ncbi:ABC transporter ATP-binding protein [candidate division WOR-3 bacterium JGI_Cruoil_03_44_89]|uniref:ABC transporter ATP-binding protein n=1 Tax=candidate division WOR-3 bacterium JGI_Cruoil_03_44_89 TaxID=1973748 RepID=A0A235BX21_UNCW3|nr:MAG: ABC transporter ATP-binding protein [candidate division WOR-3 bacterium JGI_Cruoil_03_44_89]
MIEIENLYKSFNGNDVLKGLSLKVKEGETTAVIGRSGCGKSVLLKHIIGLLRPDKGDVWVDGQNVKKLKRNELYKLRLKMGVVFQSSALLDSLSVGENVALGLTENIRISRARVREIVLEKLSLVELEGVEHKRISELSGGMKKRVAVARALAVNPSYILYDEPTTALDPITARTINELMLSLKKKIRITGIVVTHDMESAFYVADRIAMLHDGKIIFDGTPMEVQTTSDPIVQRFVKGGGKY